MTDDLVSRLRNAYATPTLCNIAADRIEELERKITRIRKLDAKAFANWKKRELFLLEEIEQHRAALAGEKKDE